MVDLKREIQIHSDIFLSFLAYFGMLTAEDAGMNCITQSGPGVGCDGQAVREIASDSLGTGRAGGHATLKVGDFVVRWLALMGASGVLPGQGDAGKRAMDVIELGQHPSDSPIQNADETPSSNLATELSVECAPRIANTQDSSFVGLPSHTNGFGRLSGVIAPAIPGLAGIARKSSQTCGTPEGRLVRKGKAGMEAEPASERVRGTASSNDVSSLVSGAVPVQGLLSRVPDHALEREPKIVGQLMRVDLSEPSSIRTGNAEFSNLDDLAIATIYVAGQKKTSQEEHAPKAADADFVAARIRGNSEDSPAPHFVDGSAQERSHRLPVDPQTAICSIQENDGKRRMEPLRSPKSPPHPAVRADQGAFSAPAHRKERAAPDGSAIVAPEAAFGRWSAPGSYHSSAPGAPSQASAHFSPRASDPPLGVRDERSCAPDGFGDGPKPHWVHVGSQRAEAGFEDPSFGWIGVRAERDSGGLRAVLVPSSNDAEAALSAHLSGLNSHLANNHIQMPPVTVSSTHEGSSVSSFSANSQHESDRQREHADGPSLKERIARGEPGAGDSHDSERNLTFFAVGNPSAGGLYVSLVA